MCFEIRIPLEKTKKDKVFYKVLITDGVNYYTPYMNKIVHLGTLYETYYRDIVPDVYLYETYTYKLCVEFGDNVFHLCRNKREAKRFYETFKFNHPNNTCNLVIVKAFVPKGSLLIKGFNEPFCVVNKVMYNK